MTTTKNTIKVFITLAGMLFALLTLATASAQEFAPDVDYIVLDPPQPVRVKRGEVEVIEFFNYSCPHCFRTQAFLKKWQAEFDMTNVRLVQQPVFFQNYRGLFARFHYTLVALGIEDEFSKKLYDALHKEKQLINSPGRFVDWLEDNGVDGSKAEAAFDSFSVNINTQRAQSLPSNYGISSTPNFAVAGKYVVAPSLSGTLERMFETLSYLVDKERAANQT